MIEAYPLQWPAGWPRTQNPKSSAFRPGSPHGEAVDIGRQLRLMQATKIVINSNMMYKNDGTPYARQGNIEDTGVAVYFTLNGEQQCIPCDKWRALGENLRAINKTIEALRGLDRWGAKEMVNAAFRGFKALPESVIVTEAPWYVVLGVEPDAPASFIRNAYRDLVKKHHPDAGGNPEEFKRITAAYKRGMS